MPGLSKLEEAIPALRRYARALLRDRAEADDLVQDCLVRALDRLDSRTDKRDIRPWLFTIMHNLYVSRWRRLKRRAALLIEAAAPDESAMPAPQPLRLEMMEAMRALALLPEDQRHVILLVAVEGFEYAEVSAILGIPIGTVMSRLSRARDRLSAVMQDPPRRSCGG